MGLRTSSGWAMSRSWRRRPPRERIAWYCETLGMKPSELIYKDDEANVLASFIYLDKGPAWTDHHTVAIVGAQTAVVDHVSFECRDFDDLGMGYQTMVDKGYIGRHFHCSQVFDYWTDPAGFHVEHYVDGDLVNADNPALKYRSAATLCCSGGRPSPAYR